GSILVRTDVRLFDLVFTRHQLATQELANGGLRDVIYEGVSTRPLERGQARCAAKLIEFCVVDRRATFDERSYNLAPALVGKPDHRYFRHSRMQRQAAFNLNRRNVFATSDDHVVDASGDK